MSIYDKSIKNVADIAARIMAEELKGNQHKIDVAEPKGKITGADLKKLRDMKKEETEIVDEGSRDLSSRDDLNSRWPSSFIQNKTPAGRAREAKRKQEFLKQQIKSTKKLGGPAGPVGKLPEEVEQTDEAMSHQARTTMKHIPNPTAGEKKAAKDIKPGVAGYRDRIDMLKSAEARGGLKKEEIQQIYELKRSTLGSYVKKASADAVEKAEDAAAEHEYGSPYKGKELQAKSQKRLTGVNKAATRLAKEEVEELEENMQSHKVSVIVSDPNDPDMSKRKEKIVKRIHVGATDKERALDKAKKFYKKKGYKVHGAEHYVVEAEELDEMETMIEALIQEYEAKGGVYKHKGTYGYSGKGAEHGQSDHNEKEDEDKPKKPARGKYGARQNYVRSSRVNESFSELLSKYIEGGVKGLNESLYVEAEELTEEPDNEQFTKEVETQKQKNKGELRNDKGVAAAAVQSVSVQKEETEQMDEIFGMFKKPAPTSNVDAARKRAAERAAGNKEPAKPANVWDEPRASMKRGAMEEVEVDDEVFEEAKKDKEELPFTPDKPKKNPPATAGKHGQGYSTARHLARMALKKYQKEEVEQIDEVSAGLARRAQLAAGKKSVALDTEVGKMDDSGAPKKDIYAKIAQRDKADAQARRFKGYADRKDPRPEISGPAKAAAADRARRMAGTTNEEFEQIEERTLTEPETTEKERLVKGMKKRVSAFKDRYGERGKSVMYATATKMAKERK